MSEAFSPERTAAALLSARRARIRRPLEPFPHPLTTEQGIAAQRALATLCDSAAPAGFKIGATTAKMQAYLGLPGPAAGFMPRDGIAASGSTLEWAGFLRPGVECELCVHLRRDIPPGPCTQAEAEDAVDLLMAAIEVVENRYADLQAFGTPALIADQTFHAAAVLGTPIPAWRELDLAAIPGELLIDGRVVASGTGGELLGHPMKALAWLAGSPEAAAFGGLRAGQVVMLGSVTPPIWLDAPATVEVRFPPLQPVTLTLV